MVMGLPLAIAQLGDRRVRRVLTRSLLLTLALFTAVAAAAGWLLTGLDVCAIAWSGRSCEIDGGLGTLAAVLLALAGLWLLFPAVAIAVLGIFSDEVVEAVEVRHYPAAAASGRSPSLGRGVALGLRSAGRLIGWNLLALPFYIVLLVTGIGPFLLFLLVNALVLGRDLGEMVAVRHLEGDALRRWLASTRLRRAMLGLAATGLFMIPFVNLLAPVLGAAMATHIFHAEAR